MYVVFSIQYCWTVLSIYFCQCAAAGAMGSIAGAMVVAIFCCWEGLSEQRQLRLSRLDHDAVEGVYTEGSSLNGIRFVSTASTLYIGDLKGNVILRASQKFGPFRVVQIGEKAFLQYSHNGYLSEYEVPASLLTMVQSVTNPESACRDMLADVSTEESANVRRSIESSILRILEMPETALLERAAFSIGDYSVNGREYACALPLYVAALQVKKLQIALEDTHSSLGMSVVAGDNTHFITNGDNSCLQLCPPCPDESCLGMCGPSCKCWNFVCGDCCFHLGCYDHDVCCRKKFYRTVCLFPLTFRCEEHYNCTSAEGYNQRQGFFKN